MSNIQNLFSLLSETDIYTAFSVGVFFVFLIRTTEVLLYLSGTKSAYLFDGKGVCNYLSKSAMPEIVRLKILFLSYPKEQKAIFSDYLQEPTEKPSKAFSKTLEQLKCEILSRTNYNRNVAIFFFLITAIAIFSSSLSSIETKICGAFAFALVLLCTDWIVCGLLALLKLGAYKEFKRTLEKLDDFHHVYNAKYRCGLFPQQTANSPFLKTAMSAFEKPAPKILEAEKPNAVTVLEKRPQQAEKAENSTLENKIDTALESLKSQDPETAEKPESVESLLHRIKTATDSLDFDSFGNLSASLSKLISSGEITQSDQQTLQNGLDDYLKEFEGVEKSI